MCSKGKKITALMLSLTLSLSVSAFLPGTASAADQFSGNLITNGGFESGMSGWNDPERKWGNNDTSCLAPHSGDHYAWPYRGAASHPYIYQDIALSADCAYMKAEFSVYIGGDPGSGLEKSYAELEFRDKDGTVLKSESREHIGAQWTLVEMNPEIPDGTETIRVLLKGDRQSGSACDSYFDDAQLLIPRQSFMTADGVTYLITAEASGSTPGEASFETVPQGKLKTAAINTVVNPATGLSYRVTGVRAKALKGYDFRADFPEPETITVQLFSMKKIGSEAFAGAKGLHEVWLNAENIGNDAFSECKDLKSVYLGTRTKSVGKKAFFKDDVLKNIEIKGDITDIGSDAFKGIPSKCTIKIKVESDDSYNNVKNLLRKNGVSKKASISK